MDRSKNFFYSIFFTSVCFYSRSLGLSYSFKTLWTCSWKIARICSTSHKNRIARNRVVRSFSDVFLPKEANAEQFAMPRDQFAEYLEECRILQSKYSDKIQIKIASEVDYYPDPHVLSQLYSELKNMSLNLIISSDLFI